MPGLSLSPTVYSKLDIEEYKPTYLRWMNPEKDESLDHYSQRLIDIYDIKDSSDTLLLGHSLGGIVMQTMATHLTKARIGVISSVKNRNEIPAKIRMLKYGYAYHLAGKSFIKATIDLWGGYHGYDSDELKQLLIDEVETLDNDYYIWAYKQIIYWEGLNIDLPVFHIHGTDDRTFPLDNIENATPIEGGDHLMVYKKAEEVSAAINKILSA